MSYKSYLEQIREHITFLQSKGFDIEDLKVDEDFVRSHQVEKQQYRGELAYKTRTVKLNNGLTGIQTWFRGPHGETSNFQTYGIGPTKNEGIELLKRTQEATLNTETEKYEVVGRKAFGFWQYSTMSGRSDYLERKKVGNYGIRFRQSQEYGNTAVIPMADEYGRIWSYQLLNPDGTKRQPKDARTDGLFHMIGIPENANPIGIAESYVTSASCFELTSIPTACAFSCQNLKRVAMILQRVYPKSKLIIFADNDRHLEKRGTINQGISKGLEVIHTIECKGVLITPNFGDSEVSKGLSDWNDLISQKGFEYAKSQIEEQLKFNGIQLCQKNI